MKSKHRKQQPNIKTDFFIFGKGEESSAKAINNGLFDTQVREFTDSSEVTSPNLLFLGHTGEQAAISIFGKNTATIGGLTPEEFAQRLANTCPNNKNKIHHIYLIGCEAGFINKDTKDCLAQKIADALWDKGFKNLVVHAMTNPIDDAKAGMRIKVISDPGASALYGRKTGDIQAFMYNEEQIKHEQTGNVETHSPYSSVPKERLIDEWNRPVNTFTAIQNPKRKETPFKNTKQEKIIFKIDQCFKEINSKKTKKETDNKFLKNILIIRKIIADADDYKKAVNDEIEKKYPKEKGKEKKYKKSNYYNLLISIRNDIEQELPMKTVEQSSTVKDNKNTSIITKGAAYLKKTASNRPSEEREITAAPSTSEPKQPESYQAIAHLLFTRQGENVLNGSQSFSNNVVNKVNQRLHKVENNLKGMAVQKAVKTAVAPATSSLTETAHDFAGKNAGELFGKSMDGAVNQGAKAVRKQVVENLNELDFIENHLDRALIRVRNLESIIQKDPTVSDFIDTSPAIKLLNGKLNELNGDEGKDAKLKTKCLQLMLAEAKLMKNMNDLKTYLAGIKNANNPYLKDNSQPCFFKEGLNRPRGWFQWILKCIGWSPETKTAGYFDALLKETDTFIGKPREEINGSNYRM